MIDFKNMIADGIAKCIHMESEEIRNYIEVPPDKTMGDYAFPCFKLAKTLKKAPPAISEEIKSKLEVDSGYIERFEVVGRIFEFFRKS